MTTLATPMKEVLRSYVRCGTPWVLLSSLDNWEAVASIAEDYGDRPLIQWDLVRGHVAINRDGQRSLDEALPPDDGISGPPNVKALTSNPVDALSIAQKFSKRTITFWHNLQLYLPSEAVQQAISNLRDTNASNLRCCIGVGPAFDVPQTIAQDMVLLDEPAPTAAMLEGLVESNRLAFNASQKDVKKQIPEFEPAVRSRAADACLGQSMFAASNALAVNTTSAGLNIAGLWTAKISKIGQTKGMSIHRGDEQIENYQGYDWIVETMKDLVNGTLDPRALWMFDEIDKDFAGNAGDNTGVSQELHGAMLKDIQDDGIPCLLLAGVWGTGKTELIKCMRNAAKGGEIAMINSSLSAMKSGIVGSSMIAYRTAYKIGMALSGNRPLMIFTANSLKPLSPEFRSRMIYQVFFEKPNKTQVGGLWQTYMRKYELPKQEIPEADGWVGREVRKCCWLSSILKMPLIKVARGIVPQTIASASKLAEIRREATNALIDANTGGPYVWNPDTSSGQRAFDSAA